MLWIFRYFIPHIQIGQYIRINAPTHILEQKFVIRGNGQVGRRAHVYSLYVDLGLGTVDTQAVDSVIRAVSMDCVVLYLQIKLFIYTNILY